MSEGLKERGVNLGRLIWVPKHFAGAIFPAF
jgi:hypothetical protein